MFAFKDLFQLWNTCLGDGDESGDELGSVPLLLFQYKCASPWYTVHSVKTNVHK